MIATNACGSVKCSTPTAAIHSASAPRAISLVLPASNNQPPPAPCSPRIQSFATSTNQIFISWVPPTDPDGPNILLEYQFNFVTATSSPPVADFDEAAWKKSWLGMVEGSPDRVQTLQEATPGNYYIFGLRVIDELGATSTVAVTEAYRAPVVAAD